MSCEHAETTVLLYLFGEAPEGFEDHLAGCAACQEALAEHAATVRAVEPAFETAQVTELRPPARSRWLPWMAAAAAVVGLVVLLNREDPGTGPAVAGAAAAAAPTPPAAARRVWTDPIETELDDIDLEFESLARDLEEP